MTLNDCFEYKAEEEGVVVPTPIDDNAVIGQSGKSIYQLIIIRCTRSSVKAEKVVSESSE